MRSLPLLVRQLHIYAGLQALLACVVFGLTGIGATLVHAPSFEPPQATERRLPLGLAADSSPRQRADRAFERLGIALGKPPGDWALTPDAEGQIRFTIATLNSRAEVLIGADGSEAVVSERPLSIWETCVALHEVRLPKWGSNTDLRITLWALYIELSIWSLWFFVISGLYLWIAVKPLRPLSIGSFAAGWVTMLASVWWMW